MTLREYVIERLSDYPIIEALNDGEYIDNQIKNHLNEIGAYIKKYADGSGKIKNYVISEEAWELQLKEEKYKEIFNYSAIQKLDKDTYDVLNSTEEVKYDADGNFDKLDKKSKDIIIGRIFMLTVSNFYYKLLQVINKEKVIENFIADSDSIDNVALTIVKILLLYVSLNVKSNMNIDFLLGNDAKNKENKDITPNLMQIILYVLIIEDMKALGIDNKTIGKLQNYMNIE